MTSQRKRAEDLLRAVLRVQLPLFRECPTTAAVECIAWGIQQMLDHGLWRSASERSERSFHIRYLANENIDRTTSSLTSQPLMSLIAWATVLQINATSRPESSFGSAPSPMPRLSSKS